ncbi:MAG TPA: outer membrane beta-barrel protein [Chitinophagaceae bacterium]|nr:outer membrane beta-barrel protein [Chitinophagaceae bacterium]
MKRKLKIIIATLVLGAVSATGRAQKGDVKFNLDYNYSMPMGNFKNNIISNASPRGGTGEIMYSLSNKVAIGGLAGYQDYYQKYPRALYKTGPNETTSAVLTNSIQSIPVMAKVNYMPLGSSGAPVQPYLSGAAGFTFIGFKQYLGEFGSSDNAVSFAAKAGAGVFIPFGKLSAAGVSVGADYNYVPYNKNGFGSLNSLNVHAGVYFPLR